MDYKKKTREINEVLMDIALIRYQFPLITDMLERKRKAKREYFARIDYNLKMYGTSPLQFDDINYKP
jgi:hypothetical protein